MSIKSTYALYEELKKEGLAYLMTSRLNQDCLENFFSQLRLLGGHNSKPNSFECLSRLRLLITSKDPSIIDFQVSGENDPDEVSDDADEVITHSIFKNIDLAQSEENGEGNDENNHLSYVGEQGLAYVVGYIAKKLHKKFPSLGSKDPHETSSRWVAVLSYGGLFHPSTEFFEACKLFERDFLKFHGDSVSMCLNPIETFSSQLVEKYPNWDYSILNLFSRTRFFIRIKELNKKINVDRISNKSRAKKQIANHL